jgi:hypothetical protein
MNIYEKLQTVRVALQEKNLKKSGKNTYSNYEYYELSDFLPAIMQLMAANKMTSTISFTKEQATLTLIDIEKPEAQIVFTSPMASAALKAAHEIQNLGAVETYQRRYLYMTAFEIVEADFLDITQGKAQPAPASQAQTAQNTDPGWCSPIGSNMFVFDSKNSPKTEIERLWQFANWNSQELPGYIANWASRNHIPEMNDTTYAALLKELTSYLQQTGMQFEAIPF